jgi:hypothetical protein
MVGGLPQAGVAALPGGVVVAGPRHRRIVRGVDGCYFSAVPAFPLMES